MGTCDLRVGIYGLNVKHMDKRDAWLLDLYDGVECSEGVTPADGMSPAADSGDSMEPEEAAAIREIKALLDARLPKRPDATALRAVLEDARDERPAPRWEGDRSGLRRSRTRRRLRIGVASTLLVVAIALVGVWQLGLFEPGASEIAPGDPSVSAVSPSHGSSPVAPLPGDPSAVSAPGGSVPESGQSLDLALGKSVPLSGGTTSGGAVSGLATEEALASGDTRSGVDVGGASNSERFIAAQPYEAVRPGVLENGVIVRDHGVALRANGAVVDGNGMVVSMIPGNPPRAFEVLAWDQRDDVIELHRYLGMLDAGMEQGWGVPAVPLEILMIGEGEAGMVPVGMQR